MRKTLCRHANSDALVIDITLRVATGSAEKEEIAPFFRRRETA